MKITKRQLRQIIREAIGNPTEDTVEVMNSDTGEYLILPSSYSDRYSNDQEIPAQEFDVLYDELEYLRAENDDVHFDPEEALDELRATAQVVGNDWSIDNPGQPIEDVAYDLAAGIELQVSQATWDSALEMFDGDNEELIWALAEAMT